MKQDKLVGWSTRWVILVNVAGEIGWWFAMVSASLQTKPGRPEPNTALGNLDRLQLTP